MVELVVDFIFFTFMIFNRTGGLTSSQFGSKNIAQNAKEIKA